jgi:hypothetical protein
MPKIVENDDGTTTLSINSTELRGLKQLIDEHAPGLKKVWELAEGSDARATLDFLKSAIK